MEIARKFWVKGLFYANKSNTRFNDAGHQTFIAFYGVTPQICAVLWGFLENGLESVQIKHLLWALSFLKNYNIERVNASIFRTDPKTFRKWCWMVVKFLAGIDVVSFFSVK